MRIGIDIDNTILDYSEAFLREARMLPGLEQTGRATKADLKSLITSRHGETEWTRVQGRVYSSVPSGVRTFSGFPELLRTLTSAGNTVSYMSHKSRNPIAGPSTDLRAPVTKYLYDHGLISKDDCAVTLTYFETKEEKIQGIAHASFDVYIDDLLEILNSPDLSCKTIHFACQCNPQGSHLGFKDWLSISKFFASYL